MVAQRHLGDQPAPVGGRVGVVQAVHVTEQHEQVCMHEVSDQRSQSVVVAEPDLAGGDGVVLVHDRQYPELEELGKCLVGVAVVTAPGHVVRGEQHLSGHDPVGGELIGVAVDEQALADCRGCLLGWQRPGAALQAEWRQSRRDRTRRDQDDLDPAGVRIRENADQAA